MDNKYCINCGLKGHKSFNCNKPIISIGIILYNINNNNIEYLMIRRKHTLGFIEFIRCNYKLEDINYILKLISVMTNYETNIILNNNYEYLWKCLWHIKSIVKNSNYINNEQKFNKLKDGIFINNEYFNLQILFNKINNWTETEWEFPKGKRKYNEIDILTAKREFNEETNINENNYKILDINPFVENYIGINNLRYRNIYYIGKCNNKICPRINYKKKSQYCEISKIEWFDIHNTINKIRPYYKNKIKILDNINKYIMKIENILL